MADLSSDSGGTLSGDSGGTLSGDSGGTLSGDSGGTPWVGRSLPAGGFSGGPAGTQDTGEPDVVLAQALSDRAAGLVGDAAVVAALSTARVLVPVVARAADASQPELPSQTPGSVLPQASAEMALVTLTSPQGQRALPVFTGVSALTQWTPQARPVPVSARQAALSAVTEGADLLVVDPAGPVTFVVSRPAMWAVGQGRVWVTPLHDEQVHAALAAVAQSLSDTSLPVLSMQAAPTGGDPTAGGSPAGGIQDGDDLAVLLTVPVGLTPEQVRQLSTAAAAQLQANEVLLERVGSLTLRIVAE